MEEGWHTYWQFSGDAGAPTQVEWGLPEGWNAGPLQWPLPKKYEEQGDLIVYGYADRTLLISRVQVPDSAACRRYGNYYGRCFLVGVSRTVYSRRCASANKPARGRGPDSARLSV